jgi:hypothetical protein
MMDFFNFTQTPKSALVLSIPEVPITDTSATETRRRGCRTRLALDLVASVTPGGLGTRT